MSVIPLEIEQHLKERIAALDCFPVQSQLLEELTTLLSSEQADLHRLASITKRDIGLSARFYKHAISKGVLPEDHLTLICAIQKEIPAILNDSTVRLLAVDVPMLGFSLASMSARALKVGILSQNIAVRELPETSSQAYFAGYFHEIGLYALCAATLNNKKPDRAVRAMFSNEQALRAGTLLLESWKAAFLLVEAVACQLEPQRMSRTSLSLAAVLNISTSVVAAEDSPEALGSLLKVDFFEAIGRQDLIDQTKLWIYSTFKQGV